MIADLGTAALLLLAGVAAGVIGTAGGVTSLVSYPALLAFGVSPLAANVTNSVALVGSGLTSAIGAHVDLDGRGPTVRRLLVPMVLLSTAGAVLLVVTPPGVFRRVVPFLIALASLLLLLQPWIARRQLRRGRAPGPVIAGAALAGVGIYNGYFGAGTGIALIALLMLTADLDVIRANAMKNVLTFCADLLPAVLFAFSGRVVWSVMWPVAIGAALGGLIGPRMARRLPPALLRLLIGCSGLLLAVYLLATG